MWVNENRNVSGNRKFEANIDGKICENEHKRIVCRWNEWNIEYLCYRTSEGNIMAEWIHQSTRIDRMKYI